MIKDTDALRKAKEAKESSAIEIVKKNNGLKTKMIEIEEGALKGKRDIKLLED